MNPGSNVNMPCSLTRLEMSRASGPIVPETAFRALVLPVARFLSSYFVLMRLSDGGVWVRFSARSLARPYIGIKGGHLIWFVCWTTCVRKRRAEAREPWAGMIDEDKPASRLSQLPHISCGIYRRDRRYPRFSACRYRTDGSWSRLRPANPGRWSSA